MAYTKFHNDWQNKPSKQTPVSSEALEHIEEGVQTAHELAEERILKSVVDAKGDLLVASTADVVVRIAAGNPGQILTPDPTTSTGLRWVTPEPVTQDLPALAGDLEVSATAYPAEGVFVTRDIAVNKVYARVSEAPVGGPVVASLVDDDGDALLEVVIPDGETRSEVVVGEAGLLEEVELERGSLVRVVVSGVGSDTAGASLVVTLSEE